jgi:uncharacterized protein (TIGR03435 family)
MCVTTPVCLCLLAAAGACAQTQDASLTFEVASVKPHVPKPGKENSGSSQRGGPGTDDPGQITVDNRTLRTLIIEAYGLKGYQLVHPAWLGTERYDIVAKVAPGATKQQSRIMMRNLLVERFQLKFHREMKDLPVYELSVGKGGPKMKPSETQPLKPGETPPNDNPIELKKLKPGGEGFLEIPAGTKGMVTTFMPGRAQLTARKQTVKQLIAMIEDREDRPIIDVTGLTGDYDFTLLWSPEANDPALNGIDRNPAVQAGDAPPLDYALEQQLGLKLTPKKAPTNMMIVDSAGKASIEN